MAKQFTTYNKMQAQVNTLRCTDLVTDEKKKYYRQNVYIAFTVVIIAIKVLNAVLLIIVYFI